MDDLLEVALISIGVSKNWAVLACHILTSDTNINSNRSSVMKGVGTVTYGGAIKGNYRKKDKQDAFSFIKNCKSITD